MQQIAIGPNNSTYANSRCLLLCKIFAALCGQKRCVKWPQHLSPSGQPPNSNFGGKKRPAKALGAAKQPTRNPSFYILYITRTHTNLIRHKFTGKSAK